MLFLIAFFVRIAAIAVIDTSTEILDSGFYSSAGREFSTIAHNIVSGEGFALYTIKGQLIPSAFMPPGYVYFLALMFFLFGESLFTFILVQCIHALLGALSCVILYKLANTVFSETVGIISGFLMAVYPPLIYSVAEIHSISIYILLNILLVWILLGISDTSHIKTIVLSGLAVGFLALFRAEMVLVIPLLTLWLLVHTFRRRKRWRAALFFTAAVLVIAPWTIRNYLVFDRFLPIQSCSGYDFSRGHNPLATGTGITFSGEMIEGAAGIPGVLEEIEALPLTGDWEVQKDAVYKRAAIKYVQSHPWRTVKVTFMKFVYFWGIDVTYPLARHPLYWMPWTVVLALFIVGLLRTIKRKIEASLLYLYLLFYTALEMMFFVLPRHRLFIEPLVLVFTSYGLYSIFKRKNSFL